MFYYYGRKKRIAHLYPPAKHDSIIEPFAGSASYSLSLNNWEKDVTLYDIDTNVIRTWNYLQSATAKDIRRLPALSKGDKLSSFKSISDEERLLIGFHLNPGSSTPKDKVTGFNRWEAGRVHILANLHKIKHWKIHRAGYRALIPGEEKATWFVDPPYEDGGAHYRFGKIDYQHLAKWTKKLSGQVIVCERDTAEWLPFQRLTKFDAIGTRTVTEGIFLRG